MARPVGSRLGAIPTVNCGDGRLGYVDGFPALAFHGTLGLSWPTHPVSLDDLAAGLRTQTRRDCWTDPLGEPHCVDTPIGMTFRLASTPITVDGRGGTTIRVSPSFRDTSEVSFAVQPK